MSVQSPTFALAAATPSAAAQMARFSTATRRPIPTYEMP